MNKDIAICIPAYNPTLDLIQLVDGLVSNNFKVIIVNDGSKKEFLNIFSKLNKKAILLTHNVNKGKGQALKTGFQYILENIECIGVVIADADGQHLLKDIINVSNKLNETHESLILGSRTDYSKMPLKSKFGNAITRFVFKLATKQKVFDTQTGLRGIPFSLLDSFINIDGDRYEYEINMLIYCTQNKIHIIEVPIKTVYKEDNKSSSFNVVTDSIKIYNCLFANCNFKKSLLYTLSAILSFCIDFILLIILKKLLSNVSIMEDISLFISVVIARLASSIFNFFFNRNVVFESKKSNVLKELIQYYILVICVLIVNYLLLNLLTIRLNFELVISKIFVEIILFINNYFIQKLIIFKKSKNTNC